ncbi:hypothetical protein JOF56_010080 [Kibdelosporangium banguiense]|uniref:Winged helix DNA-binding domain-containing protein n=1 Tax=Kibdelosporangium banguiense TaxID=1365924 RepID=A0ABS4TZ60_9PSEU|nr:hypothetical protein [Kibdelosporangium banguiense]MBP2329695.1 hypothetical protein [Kibdelosporangium banguiense]
MVNRRVFDTAGRRRLFAALKTDTWVEDPLLSRQMRKHWKRGRNRTHNQIVVRSDQYRTFTLTERGTSWLAVPGLERRQTADPGLQPTLRAESEISERSTLINK